MKTNRRLTILGIIIGTLLSLAPFFGVFGTIFGMIQAFSTLASSGGANPTELSASIGDSLVSTLMGLLLFPVGIILLIFSLVHYFRLRAVGPPSLPEQPKL